METTLTKATNRKERPSKNGALMENQGSGSYLSKKITSLSVIKDKRMILYLMVEKQVLIR